MDELEEALAVYAAICAEEGVDPLPEDELAALARALLAGLLSGSAVLH